MQTLYFRVLRLGFEEIKQGLYQTHELYHETAAFFRTNWRQAAFNVMACDLRSHSLCFLCTQHSAHTGTIRDLANRWLFVGKVFQVTATEFFPQPAPDPLSGDLGGM